MHSLMTQKSSFQSSPMTFVTERAAIFETQSSDFKRYYSIQADAQNVLAFIEKYELKDFLLWIHEPILSIFGDVEKQLSLFQCWDETEPHLVLRICSNMEDLDEMMALQDKLFEKLDHYPALLDALSRITIGQN